LQFISTGLNLAMYAHVIAREDGSPGLLSKVCRNPRQICPENGKKFAQKPATPANKRPVGILQKLRPPGAQATRAQA
jgi:hypothetical protein